MTAFGLLWFTVFTVSMKDDVTKIIKSMQYNYTAYICRMSYCIALPYDIQSTEYNCMFMFCFQVICSNSCSTIDTFTVRGGVLYHLNVYMGGQTMNATKCGTPFYWKPYQNSNVPVNYKNFHPGEPSCLVDIEDLTSNCLEYWFLIGSNQTSFKWDDTICSSLFCVLCEYER